MTTAKHSSPPFVVELTGPPLSGKTTTAAVLVAQLRAANIDAYAPTEAAGRASLKDLKRDWRFNAWTLSQTAATILEQVTESRHDIVILDRGLVDALCWFQWYEKRGSIDVVESRAMMAFACSSAWAPYIGAIVHLDCNYDTAYDRHGHRLGRIVNPEIWPDLRNVTVQVIRELSNTPFRDAPTWTVRTDTIAPRDIGEYLTERILKLWGSTGRYTNHRAGSEDSRWFQILEGILTEEGIASAAEQGLLRQGMHLELWGPVPPELPPLRSLARTIASLANSGGGVLIVGITQENLEMRLEPFSVGKVRERLDQAVAELLPPVHIESYIVPVIRNPAAGYLVVAVPDSLEAPHGISSTDGLCFRGRDRDGHERPLSEEEISRMYQRRFQRQQES